MRKIIFFIVLFITNLGVACDDESLNRAYEGINNLFVPISDADLAERNSYIAAMNMGCSIQHATFHALRHNNASRPSIQRCWKKIEKFVEDHTNRPIIEFNDSASSCPWR